MGKGNTELESKTMWKKIKSQLFTVVFLALVLAIIIPLAICHSKKALYIESLEQKIEQFEQQEKEAMDADTEIVLAH